MCTLLYDDRQIKKRSNIRTPCGRESDHQSLLQIYIRKMEKNIDNDEVSEKTGQISNLSLSLPNTCFLKIISLEKQWRLKKIADWCYFAQ